MEGGGERKTEGIMESNEWHLQTVSGRRRRRSAYRESEVSEVKWLNREITADGQKDKVQVRYDESNIYIMHHPQRSEIS